MKKTHIIRPTQLDWQQITTLQTAILPLQLSPESVQRIEHCRSYLEQQLMESETLYYGINTGFGALCNVRIPKEDIEQLQYYLVQSHACGMGDLVPPAIVRGMLFLKIQNLSYGYSGVRRELIEKMIAFYNHDILPVIYEQGSLGASGDLVPLAHLSLPFIGLGDVWYKGERKSAAEVMAFLKIEPLRLQSKEGLALLNGTQFSTAYGVWCVLAAMRLYTLSNLCAALSLDVFECNTEPFETMLHRIRPHRGQVHTAEAIQHWRAGSQLAAKPKNSVQDPYAFRCVPQVHGASWDAIEHVKSIILTEVNSITDNPNIFPDDNVILSGGNFHAQPVALSLDYLAIAMAELGSISERRTYQLISGVRGLPSFLTAHAGLHSGLMIPQYTAAAIVSQNKQLCTPASVDSIVTSNGQEDHVSMAANAAVKAYKIAENVEKILAIEWMTAAQALEFRRPEKTSEKLEKIVTNFRNHVPKLVEDRPLSPDIHVTLEFLKKSYPLGTNTPI